MDRVLLPFKQNKFLNRVFLSNIFISFHYALVIYVNSSFLNEYFSDAQISTLYIIGSILNVVILLNASKVLEKISNYEFSLYTMGLEFLSILCLAYTHSPFLIALSFITHLSAISTLLFNLDVFIESVSKDESITGSIRGTYLTITNITLVLAPLSVSFLLEKGDFSYVYILSAFLILPLYLIVRKFKYVEEAKMHHIEIEKTVGEYVKSSDLYNVFVAHTLLQLFYGFMVIYTPLYLGKYIGFAWSEIGVIFTIMLVPFVIFELPVGELADDKYGEKEFMTIGFVIMGLFTLLISFITVKSFWLWSTVLFITRIGASLVEISTESYFFKKVDNRRTDVVSLFRISRPLALVLAPIIATVAFGFIPFKYIFIIVGSIMIVGTHYSLALRDTK